MFVVCKNKDKPKKQYKKSTSFIVNSILSFLFCLSLIVFLLIMNINYQGGDGTYSWLTIVFESMTPYLLFDSQNTFYNKNNGNRSQNIKFTIKTPENCRTIFSQNPTDK